MDINWTSALEFEPSRRLRGYVATDFGIDTRGVARIRLFMRAPLRVMHVQEPEPRGSDLQRVTVTLDGELLAALDALARSRGYGSRSEALRDIVRDSLNRQGAEATSRPSYGALSYVYDHETRDLARRLVQTQHDHHDLTIASLHVHLDHARCLEMAVLRGPAGDLRNLADEMTNQRGVRFGHLHLIPDERERPHNHQDEFDRS